MGDRIESNRIYSIDEACKVLQIPESTFRIMLYRGEIRGRKTGRRWRFLGEDLLKVFESPTTPGWGSSQKRRIPNSLKDQ